MVPFATRVKETAGKALETLKSAKPVDFVYLAAIVLVLLFILPSSRRLILDGFSYSGDSFHPASDTRYFFEKAVKYAESGRSRLSIWTFGRNSVRINPEDPYQRESVYNLGVLYYQLGQAAGRNKSRMAKFFDRAGAVWDRYLALYPWDEAKKKSIIDARTFIDSIDEAPRNPQAKVFKDLGQQEYYNHDYAAALDNYLKAIKLDPTYDTAYNNIGAMFYYLGEDKFKQLAARGLSLRARLAVSNTAVSNFKNAITYWEKAVLLNPKDNKELYLSIAGVCQQYLRDSGRSIYFLKQHLKLNPKDPQRESIESVIRDYESTH